MKPKSLKGLKRFAIVSLIVWIVTTLLILLINLFPMLYTDNAFASSQKSPCASLDDSSAQCFVCKGSYKAEGLNEYDANIACIEGHMNPEPPTWDYKQIFINWTLVLLWLGSAICTISGTIAILVRKNYNKKLRN